MRWDANAVKEVMVQLRAFGDDTTLIECKDASGGMPESIGETLCAFANMPQTGIIILGVSEQHGFKVTGLQNPAQMEKRLVSLNRNSVKPAPQLTFHHVTVDSLPVLVVEVTPLLPTNKPAQYKGEPYLRQADGDYVMNANDIRILEVSALTHAEQPEYDFKILQGTDVDVLDERALNYYVRAIRESRGRLAGIDDDRRLLQMTNVCDADGNLRLAGLYALGFLPQATEPALGATAAVRLSREDGQGRNRNLVELEGPIPAMLEEGMGWIRRNTTTISAYDNRGNLVDIPEFPPSAIREVLANALVHRDLGPSLDVGKKIEIRITDRALIVKNPGGLRGLSVQQLESSALTKAAVNRRLYEIARYLRLPSGERVIEGEGGGIQEVFAATREARRPRPRFIDNGVEFTVIFPRGSRFTPEEDEWLQALGRELRPTEEDLLVTLRIRGALSKHKIMQHYGFMSESAFNAMIDRLVDKALVESEDGVVSLRGVEVPERTLTTIALSENELLRMGKNVPVVYVALSRIQAMTLRQLREATGLSAGQLRYALAPLLHDGYVTMLGGQGSRTTTYELAQ